MSSSTEIVSPCKTRQSGAPEGGQLGECSVPVGMTGLMDVGRWCGTKDWGALTRSASEQAHWASGFSHKAVRESPESLPRVRRPP